LQLGRRNLSAYDRSRLALQLEPLIAGKAKENQIARKGDQAGASCQKSGNLIPVDTKKELATIAGVSHDTIAKVKAIEEKAAPEGRGRDVLPGKQEAVGIYCFFTRSIDVAK